MTITDADYASLKLDHAKLKGRVALLEREVQFLLEHLNLEFVDTVAEPTYPEVAALKRNGKIIEAITAYRAQTGVGLAEAKLFVDNLEI